MPFTKMGNNPSQNPRSAGMTVTECDDMIQESLRTPEVRSLKEHLEKAGCGIGDNFIKAVDCNVKISGGYYLGEGIIVCSNHMSNQEDVNQVVKHELIHAYDECRAANMNWSDCAHQACAEIRANNLSGDCHFKRELLRGYLKLKDKGQHDLKECVRRRSMQSVLMNPSCHKHECHIIFFSISSKDHYSMLLL
ncbi:mitochondrial inner membrane protease ATP23-like [Euphorbia lathyris]|uniref:mitochondrial inner membrane protease ATP23-like n=1 Tax=Euphorbia lathyris TaxID=212925 RepID=UPI0033131575